MKNGSLSHPPVPKVKRMRLTDRQLVRAIDARHPGMADVLAAWKRDGSDAGKRALARHFRERTTPRW